MSGASVFEQPCADYRRHPIAVAVLVGCCGLVLSGAFNGQVARTLIAQQVEHSVRGRVMEARTGEPVPGAVITVGLPGEVDPAIFRDRFSAEPFGRRGARANPRLEIRSDSDGRFTIDHAIPRRVSIRVSAQGYLSAAYGQMWPGGPAAMLDIRKDGVNPELLIKMWKHSSVKGAVFLENGAPAVGARVHVIPRPDVIVAPNVLVPSSVGAFGVTNARGEYLVSGLVPGKYAIAVVSTYNTIPKSTAQELQRQGLRSEFGNALRSSGAPLPDGTGVSVGDVLLQAPNGLAPVDSRQRGLRVYRTTFYSDAQTLSASQTVVLRSGDVRSDVDFHLKLVSASRITGVVVGPGGPSPHVGVQLLPADRAAREPPTPLMTAATTTDLNGKFTIIGVPAGDYELRVLLKPPPPAPIVHGPTRAVVNGMPIITGTIRSQPADPERPTPVLWTRVPITIDEFGAEGLTLALASGARVTGRVEFDSARAQSTLTKPQNASVTLTSVQEWGRSLQMPVAAGGLFKSQEMIPGPYIISVTSAAGWVLQSAHCGGRDGAADAIDLSVGECDLAVRLIDRAPSITAEIQVPQSKTLAQARVFLFPADVPDWRMPGNQLRLMRVSDLRGGNYSSGPLPPGDYLLAAVGEATFDFDWREPEMLTQLAAVATPVSLRQGQSRRVRLQLLELN